MQERLILASQSPRRHQLLSEAGYQFEVVTPSETAECGVCSGESTPELVARLAFQKARDVLPTVQESAVLLACDTVADLHGQVLGKPEHVDHAEAMLRMLSGQKHAVYSGVCILRAPGGKPVIEVERSELEMARLTEQQIEMYLASDDWIGKAGAFGYQDNHPWLKLISGNADNVVGLPMTTVERLLQRIGFKAATAKPGA